MSADSTVLDGGGPKRRRHGPWRPVDHLEVAARLEASGFGDAAAAKGGSTDVFAYAVELELESLGGTTDGSRVGGPGAVLPDAPSEVVGVGERPRNWLDAWTRSVLLLAGAVTCSAAVGTASIPASTLLVAGAIGWIGSQFCAGAAWRRRGLGHHAAAGEVGAWLAVAVVAVVLVIATTLGVSRSAVSGRWRWVDWTGPVIVTVWAAYAVAVAVLGVMGRTSRVTGVAVAAGTVGVAGVAVGDGKLAAVTALILLFVTLDELRKGLAGPSGIRLRQPDPFDLASARNGALQAVGLAASLLALLAFVPSDQRVAVTIAAMVASALSEPLLVGLGLGFAWLARRGTSWLWARRAIVAVTVLGLGFLAAMAGGLTLVLDLVIDPGSRPSEAYVAAGAAGVASAVNGSGVLVQRAGRDRMAMLTALAAGTVLVVVAVRSSTLEAVAPWAVVAIALAVLGSVVVAARAAAHPNSW